MTHEIVETIDGVISHLEKAQKVSFENKHSFASRSKVNRFLHGLEILESQRSQINSLVIEETGKHRSLVEAEFDAALSFSRLIAFQCLASSGDVIRSGSDSKYVTVDRVPFGPAVLITSYNTPMPNLFWKLAPSFLAGNSSLVCPSPHVAKSAHLAISCLLQAGILGEEIAVTSGSPILAETATKSPLVKLVSFTGSNEVGRRISINSAPNHPRLILELGGTNPLIVMESSDIKSAARAAILSAFSNGGQRCAAGSITIVQREIYEEFMTSIEESLGDADFEQTIRDANTPLINSSSLQQHNAFISEESSRGTKVRHLESLKGDASAVPTILTDSPSPDLTCSKELFSPVMRVVTATDKEDVALFANQLPLRLTSAVWTEKVSELAFFRDSLDFGLINFNGPTFGAEPNFPFGGMGGSGNGSRDAGFNALETYSQTRIWTMVS